MEAYCGAGMVEPVSRRKVAEPAKKLPRFSTSVALSEVISKGVRFEAAAFDLEGRQAIQAMRGSGLQLEPLYGNSALADFASTPLRSSRVYVDPDHGVGFLSSSDIISMRPEIENYVSRKLTAKLDEMLVQEWDILISRSGTVGNVALASRRLAGLALSEHAIRLRARRIADAGLICSFLRSRFGRLQLIGASYGSVVQHIEPEHLARVLIPSFAASVRELISAKMMRAAKERDKANSLIDDADSALHETLRLEPLGQESIHSSGPAVSKLRLRALASRFEASYHNPRVSEAELRIKRIGCEIVALNDKRLTREIRPITKFRKRVYVSSGGIPMLSSKQLMQIDPVDVKRLAKGAHTKNLSEIALEHNMVTISRSGTIGRIQIIPAYMEGWAGSEHATRIVAADKMNPGFLYAWLASDYGQKLIKRHAYGSVILEIDKEMIGSMPIPLPQRKFCDRIGDFVLRANELRDTAWQLERESIKELEQLIESRVSRRPLRSA